MHGGDGGAICVQTARGLSGSQAAVTMHIKSSLFEGLVANGNGAAIFIEYGSTRMELEDTIFSNCRMRQNAAVNIPGGNYGGDLDDGTGGWIRRCTFKNNWSFGGRGAALAGGNPVFEVSDSLFEGNKAAAGGAVAVSGMRFGSGNVFAASNFATSGSDQWYQGPGGGGAAGTEHWMTFTGCKPGQLAEVSMPKTFAKAFHGCPFPCNAGKYQTTKYDPTKNNYECQSTCQAGTFCPVGSTKSIPCPGGRYGETISESSPDHCIACPSGYYSDEPEAAAKCDECPLGWYQIQTSKAFCLRKYFFLLGLSCWLCSFSTKNFHACGVAGFLIVFSFCSYAQMYVLVSQNFFF